MPEYMPNFQGVSHFQGQLQVKQLVHNHRLRIGSWNKEPLTRKSMEVVDVMIMRGNNIMSLQQMQWVRDKAKTLTESRYKLWYLGKDHSRNGVGIMMDNTFKGWVVDVKRIGHMIIIAKVVLG